MCKCFNYTDKPIGNYKKIAISNLLEIHFSFEFIRMNRMVNFFEGKYRDFIQIIPVTSVDGITFETWYTYSCINFDYLKDFAFWH